jgi:hypothetical protein
VRVARANKADANQPAIVKALRKAGCLVQSAGAIGNGFPDLIVSFAGVVTLMEVKVPGKGLNEAQRIFHAVWADSRLCVVTTPEEAIRAARACVEDPMPKCDQCAYTTPSASLLKDHKESAHGEQGDGKDEPAETPREEGK